MKIRCFFAPAALCCSVLVLLRNCNEDTIGLENQPSTKSDSAPYAARQVTEPLPPSPETVLSDKPAQTYGESRIEVERAEVHRFYSAAAERIRLFQKQHMQVVTPSETAGGSRLVIVIPPLSNELKGEILRAAFDKADLLALHRGQEPAEVKEDSQVYNSAIATSSGSRPFTVFTVIVPTTNSEKVEYYVSWSKTVAAAKGLSGESIVQSSSQAAPKQLSEVHAKEYFGHLFRVEDDQ